MTMAKGLTSAYVPLGAVGMRRAIADHFKDKVFYGGLTYNSHPLALRRRARDDLQVYEEDDLIERAQTHGRRDEASCMRRSRGAAPVVGAARSIGLFGIVELVQGPEDDGAAGAVQRHVEPMMRARAGSSARKGSTPSCAGTRSSRTRRCASPRRSCARLRHHRPGARGNREHAESLSHRAAGAGGARVSKPAPRRTPSWRHRFELGVATLQRWVRRQRTTGVVDPLAKGGGWTSPVDRALLQQLVDARPDQTTGELTRASTSGRHRRRGSIGPACCGRCSISAYVSKKTVAAGGAQSCTGPGRTRGLPRLGRRRRCPTVGVSRRIGRESRHGAVARVAPARHRAD